MEDAMVLENTQRTQRESSIDQRRARQSPPHIGQFSFAPTTQTTTVVTTTTTTTQFPPFAMHAPRTRYLDPKLYPLANMDTPAYLKKIVFKFQGREMLFQEVDGRDTTSNSVRNLDDIKPTLLNGDTLQLPDDGQKARVSVVPRPASRRLWSPHLEKNQPSNAFAPNEPPERPVSPESITELEDPFARRSASENEDSMEIEHGQISETGPHRKRHYTNQLRKELRKNEPNSDFATPLANGKAAAQLQQPYPPGAYGPAGQSKVFFSRRDSRASKSIRRYESCRPDSAVSNTTQQRTPGNSQLTERSSQNRRRTPAEVTPSIVPTPPIEQEEGPRSIRPSTARNLSSIPARLTVSNSSTPHDGSLPSPSLSPVTAAASRQQAGYFADSDTTSDIGSEFDENESHVPVSEHMADHNFAKSQASLGRQQLIEHSRMDKWPRYTSMHDINQMLDFFEQLPEELKTFSMHHLLRRCARPTLHHVADIVNPAMSIDFLGELPSEIGQNIIRLLDVKSLCRASQVCKRWRHVINSDETAWKTLFTSAGFTLPDGDLQRSIVEGWGWQDPFGLDGAERDIGWHARDRSESEKPSSAHDPRSSQAISGTSSFISRRPKRKAAQKLSNRNKQLKRQETPQSSSISEAEASALSAHLAEEGPLSAANAALDAVPQPHVQFESLRSLHLYKSLYRRHDAIRKNWLRDDAKPHHIAFRAHDRHVVTCLQFDTDKILTGSDDNNINVYDTKSGALRSILRGHEGGVWALQYYGNVLVSGSTDRSVRVWDIKAGREKQVFRGHTSTVRCLQILLPEKIGEDGEGRAVMMPRKPLIITGSRDSNLRVWRLPGPDDPDYIQPDSPNHDDADCPYFVRALTGHQHSVRAIAAYADTLVSGSYDCTVRVWKISTGETVHRLQGHTQKVYSVVLDQARNRCISGSMDNLVKIWSLDTGSVLHTLEGHTSLVGLLDLNSERLVSAAADSSLRIWDPENGQCKATLTAHTGAITCFQHDAQKVISGSDRTLKMWNVRTGDCTRDLLTDLSGVWQVKFNERRCVAAVQRDNMTFIEVRRFHSASDRLCANIGL